MPKTTIRYSAKKSAIEPHNLWTINYISKQSGNLETLELEEHEVDSSLNDLFKNGVQAIDISIFPPDAGITYKQFLEMRK